MWELSVQWRDRIFEISDGLPRRYQFSIGEQLRRAALSVPTNITEGTGRKGEREKKHFYNISKGSVYEVFSLLTICKKRQLLSAEAYEDLYDQAHRIASMLTGLLRASLSR